MPLYYQIQKLSIDLDDVRILNPGFEYSSDPTLKPEAFVSPVISIINSQYN